MTDMNGRHPASATEAHPRAVLFKQDRPRTIDRYIDYFGASTATVGDVTAGSDAVERNDRR